MGEIAFLARLKTKAAANTLTKVLRTAKLRSGMVVAFCAVFWSALFLAFCRGFLFLDQFPFFKERVVEYLFSVFFFFLFLMLIFSNAIISFSSLFRSDEVGFLLGLPLRSENVFLYKFVESVVFSSWAFLLLGMPVMIAYGLTEGVGAFFYIFVFFFLLVFIFLPAGLGSLIALLLVFFFQRRKKHILALLLAIAGVGLTIGVGRIILQERSEFTFSGIWVKGFLDRFNFSKNAALPSHWLTQGTLALSRGQGWEALLYFAVILANALLLCLIIYRVADKIYAFSWSKSQGRSGKKPLSIGRFWDRILGKVFFYLSPGARLLLLKDFKTFRRDPAQWGQFLIFFGLLGVYVLNLRTFAYHRAGPNWKSTVSFLNLSATALTLATFNSRFIYPLLSLEGRRFWILALAPVERKAVLLGKFAYSLVGSLLVSVGLIFLSDFMLQMPLFVVAIHAGTMFLICFGLSGITVGLAAIYPNLKEENPSKIVAGFGGTFTFLLSLAFIVAVIALQILPFHLYLAARRITEAAFERWLLVAFAVAIGLTFLVSYLPMVFGSRAFKKMEF
jgi:ABC-2 type transport system permease protein